jgi:Fe-S cluster biogenesis protein NfuA
MPTPPPPALLELLSNVAAPLIARDGGVLHLVSAQADQVVLHLSGACSGCPGFTLTTSRVLEPLIQGAFPGMAVLFTNGAIFPKGAQLVVPVEPKG